MTSLFVDDVEKRLEFANRIKAADDVTLPHLAYWNYDPCPKHVEEGRTEPVRGCEYSPQCGALFLRHQRKGVAWAYLTPFALLADTVGLGKMIQISGLLAMLKERGELTGRCILTLRNAQAALQARDEMHRLIPRISVDVAIGQLHPRHVRLEKYCQNWDVMIMPASTFLTDLERIARLEPTTLIVDDVDPLRNDTMTAAAIKRIARDCERVFISSGTPLQNRLHELHSLLEPIGGNNVFGSTEAFEVRYIRKEKIRIFDMRTGKKKTVSKVTGYKNINEFKEKLAPFVLRRTHRDLDGDDLPAVMPENPADRNIWIDMYDAQRAKYEELQRGVLRIITEEGEQVKRATALAKLAYGQQICAGLATIGEPDGPGASAKLDYLVDRLTGDLEDEKVVVFSQYKATIRALHARLAAVDVGYATIWGDEPDPNVRRNEQRRFWTDPRVRVCIGTSAMEQSLNLQVSNTLINIDLLMNPMRMEQLMGRIRRLGSSHAHIWVFNLLTPDTQEERYLPILRTKQGLIDFVWNEASELFEQLSPMQLLQLIKP